MSIKLRELIRNIRACKTAAEERSVIAKECALIRTAFKEEDNTYRHRNVAKLLFMNMLGYPTHFGQIECLKLIASHKFSNKRIGYLGLTILLDENTDILMLVTNSIKNDLKSSNQYINGIALCALGNIANGEMCSALCHEILEMLNGNNPYIKKKAAMCAIRILKKTYDLEELFVDKIPQLLEDKNHGVLSAGISLMLVLTEKKREYKNALKIHINKILKILRSCVMSGYSHGIEYDVYGITDPFLQVKILRLLKQLNDDNIVESEKGNKERMRKSSNGITSPSQGQNKYENETFDKDTFNSDFPFNGNNVHSSKKNDHITTKIEENEISPHVMEELNSILAQVATNTDSQKNVGNAILYECVKTITYISKEPGLLVLAVNILGKFLQNNDNNIRYVGLCTLQKLLKKDSKTLHIYRNTIIECLKDQDISIRKKALDVSFALITKESLKTMVKELLNYLLVADMEIKGDIVSNICVAVNKYAPNMQYLLDTYIKLFCLAGNFIQDHIKDDFICYIIQSQEYQAYSVFKLFFSMKENLDQYALIQVGTWCVGEYGDLLIKEKNIGPDKEVISVTYDDIFNLLETIAKKYELEHFKELQSINTKDPILSFIYNKSLNSFEDTNVSYISCNISENVNVNDSNVILQYFIMCLNKLTVRLPSQKKKIEKMLQKYKSNKSIEIQQRACEFHEFMNSKWDDIREQVLLRIPQSKKLPKPEDQYIIPPTDNELNLSDTVGNAIGGAPLINAPANVATATVNTTPYVDLLDLDDILGDQYNPSKNEAQHNRETPHAPTDKDTPIDLLLNVYDTAVSNEPTRKQQQLIINNEEEYGNTNAKEEMYAMGENVRLDDTTLLGTNNETGIMNKKNEDILADLFGNISLEEPKTVDAREKQENSLNLLLDDMPTAQDNPIPAFDLLDDCMKVGVDPTVYIQPLNVYDKNDIEIVFHFEKESVDSENAVIKVIYLNKSSVPVTSFIFEAAVPNYIKMEMCAASSNELPPLGNGTVTQNIKITNTMLKKRPLLMKVQLSYMKNNQKMQDYIYIKKFPELL